MTLFVVALVSVLVLEYHFDASVELDLAANYANDVQAYHLAFAGVRFAQAILQLDDSNNGDGPKDYWYQVRFLPLLLGTDCIPPQQLLDPALLSALQDAASAGQSTGPPLERRTGEQSSAGAQDCVKLLITDEGSKLPVNALMPVGTGDDAQLDPTWVQIFEAFFDSFKIDHDVVGALVDWVDANEAPYHTGGAESSSYERLPVPYKAANKPMSTAGELRLVKGLGDPETLAKLFPGLPQEAMVDIDVGSNQYLTPFPYSVAELREGRAKVNLNTAPEPVLQALFAGAVPDGTRATTDAIETILKKRLEGEQFANLNEVLQSAGAALNAIVDVKSSYFRIETEGHVGVVRKRIVAVVKREAAPGGGTGGVGGSGGGGLGTGGSQPAQPQQTRLVYFKVE